MSEKINEKELRSEEVTEILAKIPHWVIRSGSGWFLFCIISVFTLANFIKYPEIIKAPVIITSNPPVAKVISESDGYITFWVKDHDQVKSGQYLGYFKTESNVEQVLALLNEIDSLKRNLLTDTTFIIQYAPNENLQLGNLQEFYKNFLTRLFELQLYYKQDEFEKKIVLVKSLIALQKKLFIQRTIQKANLKEELKLAQQKFIRDSILFSGNVITKLGFEESRMEYLKKSRELFELTSEIIRSNISSTELESQLLQYDLEKRRLNQNYLIAFEGSLMVLLQNLKSWELKYLVKSPIAGEVALLKYRSNNEYITLHEEILAIIPTRTQYYVQVKTPITRSGRIHAGQNVNIKLDAYPYTQYGIIKGQVKSISSVPRDGGYNLEVTLTNGLTTSSNQKIDFKPELEGSAEIVTADINLLSRLYYQFRTLEQQ